MRKSEKIVRRVGIAVCEAFAAFTIVMLLLAKRYDRLPLAFATTALILLPEMAERLLRCRLRLPLYLFCLFYAVGPMLGQCHNLYYLIAWWDKFLHISGGVVFALFGLYIFEAFAGSEKRRLLFTAVFAVCFSMSVSIVWEFFEFGADCFFGMDMQDDVIVTSIRSYLLDEGVGVAGAIENIKTVTINGEPLPFQGYLDIGLTDTMLDMLIETLGALATAAAYLAGKGKHPAIVPKPGG